MVYNFVRQRTDLYNAATNILWIHRGRSYLEVTMFVIFRGKGQLLWRNVVPSSI
jgi:hypothetical protein